jgi:2-iminobutanoate/2-iminopropanoate deaminase
LITFARTNLYRSAMKQAILPPNSAKPIAPYTPAILHNGTLYLSGQIALDEKGDLHTGDIVTETRRVMDNLGSLLRTAGMGYEDLVKITILLSDMSLYGAVNEVYGSYFGEMPPAREAYAVKGLPRGVNVEISGIAVRG